MTSYDVVVLGLGGFGSATAYHCAARGLRVLGLDRHRPGHQEGSSHGESRIVRQAYYEGPDHVPLLRRAYELWDRLGQDVGAPLFVRTGATFAGAATSDVFAGSLASAEQWNIPHEVFDGAELARRFPMFGVVDGLAVLFEPDAGVVSPDDAVASHLRLAAAAGAELRHGQAVTSWAADGDGVRVTTAEGDHEAGWLVLAPGRWAPELLGGLQLPLLVERRVLHWYRPPWPAGLGGMPAWVWERADGVTPYAAPDRGRGLKVGVHHSTPRPSDAWEADELATLIEGLLPGLRGHHRESAQCWYTLTPDRHFVVGRHPSRDRVLLACGFSGHGFKFTPVIGEALAELVVRGDSTYPLSMFDPQRFGA